MSNPFPASFLNSLCSKQLEASVRAVATPGPTGVWWKLVNASEDDIQMHFACQGCGTCCRWPGEVILTSDEVEAIAAHLGLTAYDFTANYTELRRNRQGLTLSSHPDGACIFLRENRCAIQPVKPQQCHDFPYVWTVPGWRDLCKGYSRLPESREAEAVAKPT